MYVKIVYNIPVNDFYVSLKQFRIKFGKGGNRH